MDKSLVEPFFSEMKPLPTDLTPTGHLRKPVCCLLCDIYGTLFISGSGDIGIAQQQKTQHRKIEALLARYQMDMSSSKLIETFYAAIRTEHRLAKAKGVDWPEVQIDTIWAQILPFGEAKSVRSFAVEFEMIMNPVWPMPGLNALIDACKKNGLRLGIISNAQFFTAYLFEWHLGKSPQALGFDPQLTFCSYQYGWAKPSRFLYRLADEKLQEMGISTNQTAYIGNDVRNDIAPAKDVGFQTVLFAGDARSLRLREDDPTCKNVRPDLRITHLNQLALYLV